MKLIVTGGSGFIGSALVRYLVNTLGHDVLNIDKLTYASNLDALASVSDSSKYQFLKADILEKQSVLSCFKNFQPDGIFHLAAETHVDRSIKDPDIFVKSNVLGTQILLSAAQEYLEGGNAPANFRFLHVSTDEVFGELPNDGKALFREDSPYDPRSPYAASKASSDHFVRAWINTYKFPALITNCSNNYGPFQDLEKLIPLTISRAIKLEPLPVYGQGEQIRDWLFVDDHVKGLFAVFCNGKVGRSYNIGGHNERRNIDVVNLICSTLDRKVPLSADDGPKCYEELITFVKDRPGHDFRYAIDASRMLDEIGWQPDTAFEKGIEETINWYLDYLK